MPKIKQPLPLEGSAEKRKAKEKRLRAVAMLNFQEDGIKRTLSSWSWMMYRCYSPSCHGYHNYGGRGISVCDRWKLSRWNFLNAMGPRPKGFVLHRKDNDGNYEPKNCVWITKKESSRLRRNVCVPFPAGENDIHRRGEVHRRWVARNRERRRKYMIRYCAANKSHRQQMFKKWSKKNRIRRNAYLCAWWKAHPEKFASRSQAHAAWRKKNILHVEFMRKQYALKNREVIRLKARAYYLKHRTELIAKEKERYWKRKAATCS